MLTPGLTFLPYIRTNISSNEMLSLIGDIGTLMSGNLEQNRFPTDAQGQGKMIDGIYYMTFDIEEVKSEARKGINLTPEEVYNINITLTPLIKKGQTINHLYINHPDIWHASE